MFIAVENVRNHKRQARDKLADAYLQIQHLEKQIALLETNVQSLKETYSKELQNQAEKFRCLLQEQKDKMKNRIITATTKIKLLNRQKKDEIRK